jgi:hypothetical protein
MLIVPWVVSLVFMTIPSEKISVGIADFEAARRRVSAHAYHTPLLTSRLLSERTGFEIRLKAEMFQRGGSYKIRGPLNKIPQLTAEQKRSGVICSSAGNHAQGVAIAAAVHGVRAVRLWRRGGAARLDLGRSECQNAGAGAGAGYDRDPSL